MLRDLGPSRELASKLQVAGEEQKIAVSLGGQRALVIWKKIKMAVIRLKLKLISVDGSKKLPRLHVIRTGRRGRGEPGPKRGSQAPSMDGEHQCLACPVFAAESRSVHPLVFAKPGSSGEEYRPKSRGPFQSL